jgi:lipoprotein-anchoring transpeptidase ErfK/SrfK
MNHRIFLLCFLLAVFVRPCRATDGRSIVVSVADQRLALVEDGVPIASFPVSTSKYGVGDQSGSYRTPLGSLEVASRIGEAARIGAVFKHRVKTGEVLSPNASGRDPIVTRILWLRGREARNARAYERGIYIHGTPVERMIGRPASYGCIRMRSRDIVQLFDKVSVGTKIDIVDKPLSRALSRDAGRTSNVERPATGTANVPAGHEPKKTKPPIKVAFRA